MGIRGKLLLMAAVIAVPLVVVGALDLRNMWLLSRAQLNDSVMQQADLASVALERWLDDQKKALDAIAALADDKDTRTPTIRENLENVLRTRPFWLDLRITNAAGTTIMSQPTRREMLPNALTDYLVSKMRESNSWAVVTDRTVDEAHPIMIIAVWAWPSRRKWMAMVHSVHWRRSSRINSDLPAVHCGWRGRACFPRPASVAG